MDNSIQDTNSKVSLAASVPSSTALGTDVDSIERCENKQKFYKQHYLALLERCEFIQQV